MAIVCLFFPSFILCYLRNKMRGETLKREFRSIINHSFEYICGNVLINASIIALRVLIQKKTENIYNTLNQYSDFAVKYLLLGLALAVAVPQIERICRDRISFELKMNAEKRWISKRTERILVILFAVIMMLHHAIRIFDNSFWGDEGIAILAARMTWTEMLENVAANGHSPLHYAVVWIFCRILGYTGVVYHFASTLPYFITVMLTLVFVWKWFGTEVVLILTALDTLLECAVTYNLEVRMYAWCQLFIFLTYLTAYKLFKTRKNSYFFLMSIFSLGAVYSHYFAIAAVGLLYLILLLYVAKVEQKNVMKVFASGTTVLFLFVPWIIFCRKIRGMVMSNYHISEVGWYDCFEFIFHSRYSMKFLYGFFVVLFIHLIYEIGIVRISKNENKKIDIVISFTPKEWNISGYVIWILSGICAVFGTIIVAKSISALLFPIIVLRYLYPSYIIIWLLFGVSISKCRLNKLYTFVIISVIFVSCYPDYCSVFILEQEQNKRLAKTLALTVPEISEDDCIYTNIVHLAWTVEKVYYPEASNCLFGRTDFWGTAEIPELDKTIDNWLFLSAPISEAIRSQLAEQQSSEQLVVDHGFIGTGDVWIYRIVDIDEEDTN